MRCYLKGFLLNVICITIPFLLISCSNGSGNVESRDRDETISKNESYTKTESKEYASDQLLVKFKETAPQSYRKEFYEKHGFIKIDYFESIDVELITLPNGLSVKNALAICKDDDNIEYAEPNYKRYLNAPEH
ncbi:MAG: hypothetical protein GY853_06105 [PVC group bacterium]|nr:hypothetical protein [PVC group bacterium]